jgi:hypothetical protein
MLQEMRESHLSTMRALVWLFLLITLGQGEEITFLLTPATSPLTPSHWGTAHVFGESRLKAENWAIVMQDELLEVNQSTLLHPLVVTSKAPGAPPLTQVHFMTRGNTNRLWAHSLPQAPVSSSTSLAPAAYLRLLPLKAQNSIWAGFRYARLNNLSLVLSNMSTLAPHGAARLACTSNADSWCDLGWQQIKGNDGPVIGTYRVILDFRQARGSLPQHIFFLLTNGRNVMKHSSADAAARRVDYVEWSHSGALFRINDMHSSYFGMQSNVQSKTIIIGSHFLRQNYTEIEIDGQTGQMNVQFASLVHATDALVIEWAGALIAAGLMTILYNRWVTGPRHLIFGDAIGRKTVVLDSRVLWGGLALVVSLPVVLVVAWLGAGDTTSKAVYTLLIFFTVYLAIEGAMLSAMILVFDLAHGVCRRRKIDDLDSDSDWLRQHTVSLEFAWMRNTLHVTTLVSAAILALMPFSLVATASGHRLVLFLLFPPAIILIVQHTYHALGALAVSMIVRKGRQSAGLAFFGGLQLVLLVVICYAIMTHLIAPALDLMSAFYTPMVSLLGATLLVSGAVLAAVFILLTELLQQLTAVHQKSQ